MLTGALPVEPHLQSCLSFFFPTELVIFLFVFLRQNLTYRTGLKLGILLQPPQNAGMTGMYHSTQLPDKDLLHSGVPWLAPIIPATQEAEISRITV
jgi:hypothetical protein